MRVVLSLLSTKVAAVSVRPAILPLETILAGPGFDQCPIDGEMLVGHQAFRARHDPPKEAPRGVLVQQSIPVLRWIFQQAPNGSSSGRGSGDESHRECWRSGCQSSSKIGRLWL